MPGPDLRMLVFDVFGTLVDWRTSLIDELTAWGEQNATPLDWAAFTDAWRAEYAPAMARVNAGETPWTKLDDLHRQSLDRLLTRFGAQHVTDAQRHHLVRAWHRLRPWPDTVEGLTRLRTRYVLSPMSNGNVALLTNLARSARLPFDLILSAELARAYKPAPQTYALSWTLMGLEPNQVMLVAAHNADLAAAQAQGMRAAYVNRPTEYGPHQTRDTAATGRYDYLAESVTDLATQMGQ